MPGITGIISDRDETTLFEAFLASLKHLDYKTEVYQKKGIHIGRVFHGYINKNPQPLISENRRYIVFFYGEIFSYEDIDTDKISDSAAFFLKMFQQEGFAALKHFNGQFTSVIQDLWEKKTYIFSDKMGTKPVYYMISRNRLLFSSEVKTLLQENVPLDLNWKGVSELFHFGHLWGNKTLFEKIFQIPPASYLVFHHGKKEIKKYWEFPYDEKIYHDKEKLSFKEKRKYVEELKVVLSTAMKRSLIDNENSLLIPLSGGLDSRFVVAFAHNFGIDPIKTFTIGAERTEDQAYAAEIVKLLGLQHDKYPVIPENFWEDARDFSFLADGMSLIYGPAAITPPLRDKYREEEIIIAPQMNDAVFGSTLRHKKVKKIVCRSEFDVKTAEVFPGIFNLQNESDLKLLFSPIYYEKIKESYKEVPTTYMNKYTDPAHSYFMMLMNEHGRRGTLGGNILLGKYFEVRMPSYDADLLEYAFRLPLELKKDQWVYRLAFSELFPVLKDVPREGSGLPIDASVWRLRQQEYLRKGRMLLKRIPAGRILKDQQNVSWINLGDWFRGPLKKKMISFLFNNENLTKELYSTSGLEKIVSEHISGKQDHAKLLWQVINLEYFYRHFLK